MLEIYQGRGLLDTDKLVFAKIDVALRGHLHEFNTGKNTNPFAVFMAIALHTNEDGWAWPSRDLLKQETGIKSEAAITSALRHLRKMRIGGQRVFAHYRVHEKSGVWGATAYLIFPDAEHGKPPFDSMAEYTTEKQQPPNAKPLVEKPPIESLSLQEEPSSKVEPSKAEERGAPSAPSPPKKKRIRSAKQKARDDLSNALLLLVHRATPDKFKFLDSVAQANLRKQTTIWQKLGKTHKDIKAFSDWWYAHDWRGKQGDKPSYAFIRREWPTFEAWQENPDRHRAKQSTHDPIAQAQKMLTEMGAD